MTRAVVTIGLPQTGKTTFLAAFWNVVSAGEISGSMQLHRTSGDMQYLNEISRDWADCKDIGRTGPASDKTVTMQLTQPPSTEVTELAWTDMLGESFERQWTDHVWTKAYQDLVDDAVGIVLFVHPRRVQQSPLIVEAQRALRAIRRGQKGSTSLPTAPPPSTTDQTVTWDPLKSPTQVQLVEILQLFESHKQRTHPLRIAVVVSAWDLVVKVSKTARPAVWFEKTLPLLYQYLVSNNQAFDFEVFGVSAQGGDYEKDAASLRRRFHTPSERIDVVHGESQSHDISIPVRFAIG